MHISKKNRLFATLRGCMHGDYGNHRALAGCRIDVVEVEVASHKEVAARLVGASKRTASGAVAHGLRFRRLNIQKILHDKS